MGNRTFPNLPNTGSNKRKIALSLASRRDKVLNMVAKSKSPKLTNLTNDKYRPVIKPLGGKNIILTPISEIDPIVIDAPTTVSKVSRKKKRLAKLLKKIPIADIRRIGFDILDE